MSYFQNATLHSDEIGTKMRIFQALESLLKEKRFDEIRIGDICTKAGISRQTFYNHFEYKYSVIDWYIEHAYENGPCKIGRSVSWREGFLVVAKSIADDPPFSHSLSIKSDDIRSIVVRHWKEALVATLSTEKGIILTDDLLYQIDVFSRTIVEELERYKSVMNRIPPEDFARRAESIVPAQLHDLLELKQ